MKQNDTTRLTADNLKAELWSALLNVRDKKLTPQAANAIAATAREVLHVVRTEMIIADRTGERTSSNLLTASAK